MKRIVSREIVFEVIYESLFSNGQNNLEDFFAMHNIKDDEDKNFVKELVCLYNDNSTEINSLIDNHLVNYEPDRVYKIDRAILCEAITEMKFYKKTDDAIVINEAVEMAKKFGTDKSYAFVNAVLREIKG